MDEITIASFREKLDDQHEWPGLYIFKFIVPSDKISELKSILPKGNITEKASSKGTYKSLTYKAHMLSSDQVIDLYIKAKKIEGIISL
jgi:putative lipoic acid-binding regulatory protein